MPPPAPTSTPRQIPFLSPFLARFRRKKVYRAGKPRISEQITTFLFRFLAIAIVGAILFGVSWIVYRFRYFLLESTYFQTAEIVLEDPAIDPRVSREVREKLVQENVEGINLLLLDTDQIREALETIPKVKSADVTKRYPDRVCVSVTLREIAAVLLHDPLFGVDNEGVVIEQMGTQHPKITEFPFISGLQSGPLRLGESMRSEILTRALGLLSCLQNQEPLLFGKVSEVHCDNESDITLLIRGGTEIRFGDGNPLQKMPALETFLRKSGAPEQFQYIDLRFEGQVPYKPKRERSEQASRTPETTPTP